MNLTLSIRLLVLAALLQPSFALAQSDLGLKQLRLMAGDADLPAVPPTPETKESPTIKWEDAAQYVDQSVVVAGTIVRTFANDKVCFLNFSADYKTTLTLVIFASAYPKFPAAPHYHYQDKKVRVNGTIRKSSMGNIQIILNDPSEIVVTSPGETAKVVYWEDVTADMKGQQITVEGPVYSVSIGPKVAFLNFHQNWTKYVTGTIFATAFKNFPADLKTAYEGKTVRLTGLVDVYQDRPQVILMSSAQIQVMGAEAPKIKRVLLAKEKIRFDDGDTISYAFTPEEGIVGQDGKPYSGHLRLLGFDTPETLHPEDGIFYSQPKGQDASRLAERLIKKAKKVRFVTFGQLDKYNRILGHLVLDQELLAVSSIRAGLAYEMVTAFGDNGFPDESTQVLDAWEKSPIKLAVDAGKKPPFLKPGDWRKLNQVHESAMTRQAWKALNPVEKKALLAKIKAIAEERQRAEKP